jgi:hypothetical protein
LQGYSDPGGRPLSSEELRSSGPKRLAMGVVPADGSSRIVPRSTFNPQDHPHALVRLVAYSRATPIEFRWLSPSKADLRLTVLLSPTFRSYRLPYPGPRPMEQGSWTLSLHDPAAGGAELLRTQFAVSALVEPIPQGELEGSPGSSSRRALAKDQ